MKNNLTEKEINYSNVKGCSSLDALELCFVNAKNSNAKYIGVLIETRGSEAPEIIINPSGNFDTKLEYYKRAYNEELILKSFDGIRIIGFDYGNTFAQLECSLLNPGML